MANRYGRTYPSEIQIDAHHHTAACANVLRKVAEATSASVDGLWIRYGSMYGPSRTDVTCGTAPGTVRWITTRGRGGTITADGQEPAKQFIKRRQRLAKKP